MRSGIVLTLIPLVPTLTLNQCMSYSSSSLSSCFLSFPVLRAASDVPMAALSEKENPMMVLLAPEGIREDKKRKKGSKRKLETSTSFKKEEIRMANTGPPESSSSVPGSSRSKKRKKVSKTEEEEEEQKELADSSLFSLEDSTENVKKKKKKKKKKKEEEEEEEEEEVEEEVKLVEEQVRETGDGGRISVNSNLELVQALRRQTTTSERCEIHVVLFSRCMGLGLLLLVNVCRFCVYQVLFSADLLFTHCWFVGVY